MRTRLLLALAAAAVTAAVSGTFPSSDASADHTSTAELRAELRAYQAAYDEMVDGLERLDHAADRLRDRRARRQLDRIIERTRERAADQLEDVRADDDRGQEISSTELARIVKRVDDASFADDQLAVVASIPESNLFTVEQVVAIMKACSYEDTRIEAAVLLYPRVVDPERSYLIYDGLTFSSSKQTLRERLGK